MTKEDLDNMLTDLNQKLETYQRNYREKYREIQKRHYRFQIRRSIYQGRSCNAIIKGNSIRHPHLGTSIKLKITATCNSENLIYMLKCLCGLVYVGKTERKVRVRLHEHKSNIWTRNPKSPVAVHFNTIA